MLEATTKEMFESAGGLGRSFRRAGRFGFWLQLIVGGLPLIAGAAWVFFGAAVMPQGGRLQIMNYIAALSLAAMLFTIVWFWRHMRLGAAMEAGQIKPRSALLRQAWVGVVGSAVSIVLSLGVMLAEVGYLLYRFLEVPQGGVPVFQTTGDAAWVSAIDVLSLMLLTLTLAAEIIVLVLGLWLLYRVALAKLA